VSLGLTGKCVVSHWYLAAITHLDGRVGALWRQYFITSPNVDYIPEPHVSSSLIMRSDCHYGYHDFLLYPQEYHDAFCHLGAIRKRPMDGEDKDRLMWEKFDKERFHMSKDGCVSGIYTMKHHVTTEVAAVISRLLDKTSATSAFRHLPTSGSEALKMARLNLKHMLVRVSALPLTLNDARRGWVELQRAWHSLDSMWRYLHDLRDKVLLEDNRPPTANSHLMGSFTHDPIKAFYLCNAGIPVWLIRPISSFENQNVLKAVDLVHSELELKLPPQYSQLTAHDASILTRLLAIEAASHRFCLPPDPFETERGNLKNYFPDRPIPRVHEASLRLPGSSRDKPNQDRPQHSRYSPYPTQRSGLAKIGTEGGNVGTGSGTWIDREGARRLGDKAGKGSKTLVLFNCCNKRYSLVLVLNVPRDKFSPWEGDFVPPTIPCWSDANAKVDPATRRSRQLQKSVRDTGYFFPDPGLFFGVTHQWKAADFFKQWAHIKNVWILRTFRASSTPVSPQGWRDILSIGFVHSGDPNRSTRNAAALEKVRGIIGECLKAAGIETCSLTRPSPRSALDEQKVDPRLGRIRIWELCEFNFRWELRALDCRLYDRKSFNALHRQQMLLDCFVTQDNSLANIHFSRARSGLASPKTEERLRFMEALWRLMSDWPGEKPRLWHYFPRDYTASLESEDWERVVTAYYAQTFYEQFYRPPILPHTLHAEDIDWYKRLHP